MDLMSSIASASMTMSEARIAQEYSVSLTKKVMDSERQQAEQLLEMLPPPPKGEYIDVYA